MKFAYVTAAGRGKLDDLMSTVAADLQANGMRLGGVVKVPEEVCEGDHFCHSTLQVLPDGPQIRITQDLGAEATSCRLDPGALANAVAEVENRANAPWDLLIVNKFGPEESNGRGFCEVIGAALERGVPVLVGVAVPHLDSFVQFAGDMAEALPPKLDELRDWCFNASARDHDNQQQYHTA
ncbi:DUF2478 domain-containing protein [Pontibaca salina]|uniref:DUF2478 domain-containing protein n=1 Tax=Pontibaca salina TaxID=2795731 RepID=A0A934M090_9RHOB|nr:DUF2478 domain-containing protein [Pontibaca salina]MBI6629770.1 DUF2478 domain-containing protein [Pontibaca salina]